MCYWQVFTKQIWLKSSLFTELPFFSKRVWFGGEVGGRLEILDTVLSLKNVWVTTITRYHHFSSKGSLHMILLKEKNSGFKIWVQISFQIRQYRKRAKFPIISLVIDLLSLIPRRVSWKVSQNKSWHLCFRVYKQWHTVLEFNHLLN